MQSKTHLFHYIFMSIIIINICTALTWQNGDVRPIAHRLAQLKTADNDKYAPVIGYKMLHEAPSINEDNTNKWTTEVNEMSRVTSINMDNIKANESEEIKIKLQHYDDLVRVTDGKVESRQVIIGDVLNIQWANAICMTMINLVAAGVLWLGGELTWVGRSNKHSISILPVNYWLSKGFQWNSIDITQKLCVARAACEEPKMALAYIHAYEIASFILSYFSWLPPGGEYVKVSKKIVREETSNKNHCLRLYPCQNFTRHS